MQCCFCFPRQRTETPILVCVILNLLTSFDLLTRFKGLGLTINTMGNVGTTGPHLPSTIYLGISRKSTHRCRATRIHTPRASTGSEACDFILSCSDFLNCDYSLILSVNEYSCVLVVWNPFCISYVDAHIREWTTPGLTPTAHYVIDSP